MKHDIQLVPISEIKIGHRHRKDLGDLAILDASIEIGLFQPIGVSLEMELTWGFRRLVAAPSPLRPLSVKVDDLQVARSTPPWSQHPWLRCAPECGQAATGQRDQ
jgi:hypothetical protein